MEITEEIKQQEKEGISEADQKEGDLFFALLNGKTVKETVSTSRGNFVIKFPKQNDLIAIGRLAAIMRNGISAGNFDVSGDYEIQKVATLDVVVDSGPAWFNQAKKDANFSWRNMPDAHFVDEVYAKALSFRQNVQTKLRGIERNANNKTAEEISDGVSKDVGGGLFSGVGGTVKRGGSESAGDNI
ncbi:MAG: hypothetical protein FWB73_00385 [Treponema sp.]|nr:hypothetical protein [Treponema sp.]